MKVALMNGSPKPGKGMSRKILGAVLTRLGPDVETVWIDTADGKRPEHIGRSLTSCDAVVLAFPLYVDGIPAQLLRVMKEVEAAVSRADREQDAGQGREKAPLRVYPIVNCGFMDADYPAIAIDMVRLWCGRTGFDFSRAVSFCGGGMGPALVIGKGRGRAIGKALSRLTTDVLAGEGGETIFTKPTISRFLYNKTGDRRWRKAVRKNGMTKADLYRQP